jgi:quercetin dioxygenase-like cupin family protein
LATAGVSLPWTIVLYRSVPTSVESGESGETVIVHNLDPETVGQMIQVDLATLDAEPDSSIRNFSFHECTGGVTAFKGRPPWEFHGGGDELLFILAGATELTVLEGHGRTVRTLRSGHLAIVPAGRWHSNDAPDGVTMLWITPDEGNRHSWDEPPA